MPQDIGPMGMLYRADIFQKYHLAVPTTWDQFAAEAAALHKANPKIYLTDFPPTEGGAFNAFLWQAGVRPFKLNGTSLSIDFASPSALKVANYWGNLVKAGVVATDADFTPAWNTAFAQGNYATWLTAAWGPVYLQSIAANSSGKWRVAPLPQWAAGQHANGNWGGSTDAVTTQSAHPQEAADLAVWINTNRASTLMKAQKQAEFPAIKNLLTDPVLTQQPWPFFGGQKIYSVFGPAAAQVDVSFQWSPFQDYVYTQLSNVLSAAVQGKTSYTQAMLTLQSTLVTYAKQQGFTVQ
jgi:multiple sugar transport system substrate-binding protein